MIRWTTVRGRRWREELAHALVGSRSFDGSVDAADRDRGRAAALEASEGGYLRERIQRRIGPDHAQGERVMAMLGAWVRHATAHPEDPESFTPLFLAEMARLQHAPARPPRRMDLSRAWRTRCCPPPARGRLANAGAGMATGKAMDAAAGAMMGSATQEAFGKAMSALGMVAKLAKLAAFYRDEHATVTPEPRSVHKPTGDMKLVWFVARAGISKEGRFDQPGRFAMKMKRESESTAVARLGVDVRSESAHHGKLVRAYATSEARIDAAGMPSPASLIAAMFGGPAGVADAILELLTGWYQEMNMAKAYGTMEIEYHCPRPSRLHRGKAVADGGGDPGPDNCLLSAQK